MDTVYCHRKLIYSIVLTFFPLCLAVNWQVSNNAETSLTIVGQSLPNRTQAGTGLEKCPKELQFIDNDRCVKRCPKELPFYNKTDEGYQCLRMCPTGRLYYTVGINECLDVCPQPSRDTCLKTCPPDKPFIGNNEVGGCFTKCPNNTVHVEYQYFCYSQCPDEYPVQSGGICTCPIIVGFLAFTAATLLPTIVAAVMFYFHRRKERAFERTIFTLLACIQDDVEQVTLDILANKEEEREEDVMESVDEPLINGGL